MNIKVEDSLDKINHDIEISLIKTTDYVWKNNKVINDALFPRKVLKALKKNHNEGKLWICYS